MAIFLTVVCKMLSGGIVALLRGSGAGLKEDTNPDSEGMAFAPLSRSLAATHLRTFFLISEPLNITCPKSRIAAKRD
jgi:hypothetical protein